MNKQTTVVLILLGLLIGSLTIIYFKVILPNRQTLETDTINLSISAEYLGEKTKTGLEINGVRLNISRTYEIVQVPRNQITTIKNINLEGQYFYEKEININLTINKRYDFILNKPSEIKISRDYSNPINIVIDADLENPFICLKYSSAFIFVEIKNLTKIEKLERYKYWDKCYTTETLGNFAVDYKEFNSPTDDDYINISVGIESFPDLDKIVNIK